MLSAGRVELSRGAGRVVTRPPIAGLSWDRRHEFTQAVANADSFEGLPQWARRLILEAEAEREPRGA